MKRNIRFEHATFQGLENEIAATDRALPYPDD